MDRMSESTSSGQILARESSLRVKPINIKYKYK